MRQFRAEDYGEALPLQAFRRILAGESPIRIWREHRGLSGRSLAGRIGVSAGFLSDIEAGKKDGSIETLAALARELGVALDELVRPNG